MSMGWKPVSCPEVLIYAGQRISRDKRENCKATRIASTSFHSSKHSNNWKSLLQKPKYSYDTQAKLSKINRLPAILSYDVHLPPWLGLTSAWWPTIPAIKIRPFASSTRRALIAFCPHFCQVPASSPANVADSRCHPYSGFPERLQHSIAVR